MASTVFAYETSTSFGFVLQKCVHACAVQRVCLSECVSAIAALDCMSVWLCVWVILKFSLALQLSTSVTAKAPNNTDHTRICPLRDAVFFFFNHSCMSNWNKMIYGHWRGILKSNKITDVSFFWRTCAFSCCLWSNFPVSRVMCLMLK